MDGPPRNAAIVALAFLVVLATPMTAAAATNSGSLFGVQSVDPDQVLLRVDVQDDGDAQWRVEYRVRLETENETEAFESLQQDIQSNESAYLVDFTDRIRSTVSTAENSTGRTMTAQDFNVSARITQLPQEYGVLTYTFEWKNFAAVEGDRLVAGDALAGFFLDAETSLAIGWPKPYDATAVSPEPSERQSDAVVWRGPLDFGDGEPRVTIAPESADGTTTTDASGGNGGATTSPPGGDSDLGTLAIVALVAIIILGAVGFRYYRREGTGGFLGGGGGSTANGGPDGGGGGAGGSGTNGRQTAAGAAADGSAASQGQAAGAAAGQDQTPDELLSNEERVVQFLEERGGRAKQQEIVDGLDWTDAKTSQVLSGMESDDQIEKFRIGRENVVKLPGSDDDQQGIQL